MYIISQMSIYDVNYLILKDKYIKNSSTMLQTYSQRKVLYHFFPLKIGLQKNGDEKC